MSTETNTRETSSESPEQAKTDTVANPADAAAQPGEATPAAASGGPEPEAVSDPASPAENVGVGASGEPGVGDDDEVQVFQEDEPSELDLIRGERDKLKEQLLRTAADFDNFRKRTRRDLPEAKLRGMEDALREMLPVIDNLERAVAAAGQASDVKSVADGVKMVLRQFEEVGSRMNLSRLSVIGQRFDPNEHDAVQQAESNDFEAGQIMNEVVSGYRFRDRLLRPAVVVVCSGPVQEPTEEAVGSSDEQVEAEAVGEELSSAGQEAPATDLASEASESASAANATAETAVSDPPTKDEEAELAEAVADMDLESESPKPAGDEGKEA